MTQPRRSRWWAPTAVANVVVNDLVNDVVSAVWSTATLLPPVSTGAAAAYRTFFLAARQVVLGRMLTVRLPGGDVRLRLTEVASPLDARRLALGQPDDVHLTCADIRWRGVTFERATAVLRNVRLLPGAPPMVVAAPVDVTIDVPSAALDQLLRDAGSSISAQIDDDGVVWIRWARRPGWASVEVAATLDPGPGAAVLLVTPRAVKIGGRRWPLPTTMSARPIPLAQLPPELRLTGMDFGSGTVQVRATLSHWRAPVPWRLLPFPLR